MRFGGVKHWRRTDREDGRYDSTAPKGSARDTNVSRSFHPGCAVTILYFVFVNIGRIIFRLVSPRMLFGEGVVI